MVSAPCPIPLSSSKVYYRKVDFHTLKVSVNTKTCGTLWEPDPYSGLHAGMPGLCWNAWSHCGSRLSGLHTMVQLRRAGKEVQPHLGR